MEIIQLEYWSFLLPVLALLASLYSLYVVIKYEKQLKKDEQRINALLKSKGLLTLILIYLSKNELSAARRRVKKD